jgi:chromosome segregation ATPase
LHVGEDLLDGLEHLERGWFENNLCISLMAENKDQIEILKHNLKVNCPDQECRKNSLQNYVCEIEIEVQNLKSSDEKINDEIIGLKDKIKYLEEKIENIEEIYGEINSKLEGKINSMESLMTRMENHAKNLEEQNENLSKFVETTIHEMTARPCRC